MAHGILDAKLRELDQAVSSIHSRILWAEDAPMQALEQEMHRLQLQCTEASNWMASKLQHSQARTAAVLSSAYRQILQIISDAQSLAGQTSADDAESLLLCAEYALDFAAQAANRAVLLSLKAIDTQRSLDPPQERNVL